MERQLTETERNVIQGALQVAIEVYRKDASNPEIIAAGLVDTFEQQAYQADYLMGMLEDVESITIANVVRSATFDNLSKEDQIFVTRSTR